MFKPLIPFVGGLLLAAFASPLGAAEPAPVALEMQTDFGLYPAESRETGVLQVVLQPALIERASTRPPIDLCIVLDHSGSMSGRKLEDAKAAAIEALRRLDRRDRFSLVAYESKVATIIPAGPIENRRELEAKINAIRPAGSTAMYDGLTRGAAELRKQADGEFFHRMLLISDGLANVGPAAASDFSALGNALEKESISVSSIGLGDDFAEATLSALSQAGQGNFYYAQEPAQLTGIFDQELGDVLNLVAKDAIIEIEFAEGVTPVATIGRKGEVYGQKVFFKLNQLYGGNEKYGLVQFRLPPGEHGQNRPLAKVTVTYSDASTERQVALQGEVTVAYSRDSEAVAASARLELQREIVVNYDAQLTQEAAERLRAGDYTGASTVLNKVADFTDAAGYTRYANTSSNIVPQMEANRVRREKVENKDVSRSEQIEVFELSPFEVTNQQSSRKGQK